MMIKRMSSRWKTIGLAVVFSIMPSLAQAFADEPSEKPIKVLILSGGVNSPASETSFVIRSILQNLGKFDVRINETPDITKLDSLADFRLVIDDTDGSRLSEETKVALMQFVQGGGGMLLTQGALAAPKVSRVQNPAANRPLIAGEVKLVGPVGFLELTVVKPEHPIVQGLNPSYRVADALLTNPTVSPDAEVLVAASDQANAKAVPALVASNYGKGRVVAFGIGSDASAMNEDAFITLLGRASEWAALGTVSLPSDLTPSKPSPNEIKALLVTGVHDHEAAFFTLFNGDKDLDTLPILSSEEAFKKDIRGKYEVVIMYDFTRELDEEHRKNLREFVESGGGVVVLHHALLNYQTWDWWIDEVAGGSYRLSKTGDVPSSAVKNDQQIYVTPVPHAITAGLAPFHIQDEAYKNLRMSPKIRPLLTTDNPTSDVNLAWLSPDEKFRVVSIQLGHGKTAFRNPSYRILVRQAVRWAAGKTE